METINLLLGLLTMVVFVYALIIIPRALGEIRGIYMETPDPFFGKFELDCMWTHGATFGVGVVSYVVLMPLLVLLFEQIMNRLGMVVALVVTIIILIPFKLYYDKQKPINNKKAYEKNIEDGFLTENDPMPNPDGRLKKLYKKITKQE